jgi:hypothetical protein
MQKPNYVIAFFIGGANVRNGTSQTRQMAAADKGVRKQKTQDHLIPGAFRWFPSDVTIKVQVWSDIDNPDQSWKIVL